MDINEIKGLKYYIAYAVLVVGFFIYSGIVGLKWFNPTSVEHERTGGRHIGRSYIYHK